MRIQNDVGVHGNRKNSPINSIFPHSLRGLSISLSLSFLIQTCFASKEVLSGKLRGFGPV